VDCLPSSKQEAEGNAHVGEIVHVALGWLVGWLGLAWLGLANKEDVNARFKNMSTLATNTCFKKVHLHPSSTWHINALIP
jgi:hypothetical protein